MKKTNKKNNRKQRIKQDRKKLELKLRNKTDILKKIRKGKNNVNA